MGVLTTKALNEIKFEDEKNGTSSIIPSDKKEIKVIRQINGQYVVFVPKESNNFWVKKYTPDTLVKQVKEDYENENLERIKIDLYPYWFINNHHVSPDDHISDLFPYEDISNLNTYNHSVPIVSNTYVKEEISQIKTNQPIVLSNNNYDTYVKEEIPQIKTNQPIVLSNNNYDNYVKEEIPKTKTNEQILLSNNNYQTILPCAKPEVITQSQTKILDPQIYETKYNYQIEPIKNVEEIYKINDKTYTNPELVLYQNEPEIHYIPDDKNVIYQKITNEKLKEESKPQYVYYPQTEYLTSPELIQSQQIEPIKVTQPKISQSVNIQKEPRNIDFYRFHHSCDRDDYGDKKLKNWQERKRSKSKGKKNYYNGNKIQKPIESIHEITPISQSMATPYYASPIYSHNIN